MSSMPIDDLYDAPAAVGNDAVAAYVAASSSLLYGDDQDLVTGWNQVQPVYLTYGAGSTLSQPLVFDPFDVTYVGAQEMDVHTSWSGHAWKRRFPCARLVTSAVAAYDVDGFLWTRNAVPWPDDILLGSIAEDQIAWLSARFEESWSLNGFALPGAYGKPCLTGAGRLAAGETVSFTLKLGAAGAYSIGFISLSPVAPFSFMGGQLLLGNSFFPLEWLVDAQGGIDIGGPWPLGVPAGLPLTVQWGIVDAQAPFGVALSNGISAVTE
jgi:hypothetical protein